MRIDDTLTPNDGQPNFGKPFDKFLTKFISLGVDIRISSVGDNRISSVGDTRVSQK